jgi:hypothetical protein
VYLGPIKLINILKMEVILEELDSQEITRQAIKIHEKENKALSRAADIQEELMSVRGEKKDMLEKIFTDHLYKDAKNDLIVFEQVLGKFISSTNISRVHTCIISL